MRATALTSQTFASGSRSRMRPGGRAPPSSASSRARRACASSACRRPSRGRSSSGWKRWRRSGARRGLPISSGMKRARCAPRSRSSCPRTSSPTSAATPGTRSSSRPTSRPRSLACSARSGLHLGRELGLIDEEAWKWVWITDFPMFEWSEEDERWAAVHHPFTRPAPGFEESFDADPGERPRQRLRPRRQRTGARRRLLQDP